MHHSGDSLDVGGRAELSPTNNVHNGESLSVAPDNLASNSNNNNSNNSNSNSNSNSNKHNNSSSCSSEGAATGSGNASKLECEGDPLLHCQKDVKDVVLKEVRESGNALEFACSELRADREVVLAAVKQDGLALQFASEELRADRAVVLEAVLQTGHALLYARVDLLGAKEVVVAAVKHYGGILSNASASLRADKEVVLEAVKKTGSALEFASPELQNDKAVVFTAVSQSKWALKYAGQSLKSDRNFALELASLGLLAIGCVCEELADDRELVLEALVEDGEDILYASQRLQHDEDVVLLAARHTERDFRIDELFMFSPMQAIARQGRFQRALHSSIAVQGEHAPVVSINLARDVPPHSDSEVLAVAASTSTRFRCEIGLLSGTRFVCCLPDARPGSPTLGQERKTPILNDLAVKIIEELPNHTEMRDVKRVFINIILGKDGGEEAATPLLTPWSSYRSLSDLLPGSDC